MLPVTGIKDGPPFPQPKKLEVKTTSNVRTIDDEVLQADISDSLV
jgi:hypothetical protein